MPIGHTYTYLPVSYPGMKIIREPHPGDRREVVRSATNTTLPVPVVVSWLQREAVVASNQTLRLSVPESSLSPQGAMQ